MAEQFIEIAISKDGVRRETIVLATDAIRMLKSDGKNKSIIILDDDKTELIIPGVSYEEMKRKLGLS